MSVMFGRSALLSKLPVFATAALNLAIYVGLHVALYNFEPELHVCLHTTFAFDQFGNLAIIIIRTEVLM